MKNAQKRDIPYNTIISNKVYNESFVKKNTKRLLRDRRNVVNSDFRVYVEYIILGEIGKFI